MVQRSIGARKNNYESTNDHRILKSDYADYRQGAKARKRSRFFALVCFSWSYNSSTGYFDNSQGEVCREDGTGTGRFVFIDSTSALLTFKPNYFGNIIWECEPIGFGSQGTGTGSGPLDATDTAEIWLPIRPRLDLNNPEYANICRAIMGIAATLCHPVPTVGGTTPTTTLGGTAYDNVLPSYGLTSGYGYSIKDCFWSTLFSEPVTQLVPSINPDAIKGRMRAGPGFGSLNIEPLEYFRAIIMGGEGTSGSDNGITMTIFEGVFYNSGSAVTQNVLYATAGYSVSKVLPEVYTGGLTESSNAAQGLAGLPHEAYFSGSYTISLSSSMTISFTYGSYGNITAASLGGAEYSALLIIGGATEWG